MSKWDYRIVQRGDEFAVHEVFYNDDGSIEGMTADPVCPGARTVEELHDEFERYRAAFEKPVLSYLPSRPNSALERTSAAALVGYLARASSGPKPLSFER